MRKYRGLLHIAFQFCFLTATAGNLDPQFWSVEAELSQNSVTDICQDSRGFLWIGTQNGLNRYDGVNVRAFVYKESNPASLSNSYITSIFEDNKQQLWVGTMGGGLCQYLPKTNEFIRLTDPAHPSYIDAAYVVSIFQDKAGTLWIGTEHNGLYTLAESGEVHNYRNSPTHPRSLSSNYVTEIAQDEYDNIWVATWGGGMNLFDAKRHDFTRFLHNEQDPSSVASSVIRTLHTGPTGSFWVGTHRGLDKLIYRDGGYEFQHVALDSKLEGVSENFVLSILEDAHQQLWVGIENGGLNIMDLTSGEHALHYIDPSKEFGLQSNSIWNLYEDRNQVVWLGTFNKGLFKVDQAARRFDLFRHNPHSPVSISNNTVSCFAQDRHGNLWIGTDGGGLNYWNVQDQTFTSYSAGLSENELTSNAVLSLLVDRNDQLWVGTWGGGVMRLRPGSDRFERFQIAHEINQTPGTENVFSIAEDADGRIWFAAFKSGLFAYDPVANTMSGYTHDPGDSKSLSANDVRTLFIDHQQTLWVGTESGGLNQMVGFEDDPKFKHYLHDEVDGQTISCNTITSITEDEEGRLWLGTFAGLNRLDSLRESFTTFGKNEGIPNEVVCAVQMDEQGNLWLSSNKGLSRLNPATGQVKNFSTDDGLQAPEFLVNSSYKMADGRLLFGGIEGFNRFDPFLIKDNKEQPQVYFADFKLSNERVQPASEGPLQVDISLTDRIELDHDQNDFSFEFAVLSMQQSSRNKYAYLLENYDDTWQEAGNRRAAYYTNVPPGEYVFRVKGSNADGMWSENQASIAVEIHPAWYASFWAYVVYVLMALVALFLTIQGLVRRERMRNSFQLERVELSKMQELDQMKSRFFANISHEFRSPLTLLLGPLKAMGDNNAIQLTKDQIKTMIRNAESLLNLINQLLELSKLESGKMQLDASRHDLTDFIKPIAHSFSSMADRKHITYQVSFGKEVRELYFDPEKLEKIIINLLSNAFKYTPDFGKVRISIEEDQLHQIIVVEDNGDGIPEEEMAYIFNRYYRVRDQQNKSKGTGIGLSLTKELIELHHGRIELESEEGQGSIFRVYIKKGTAHLDEDQIVDTPGKYKFEKAGSEPQRETSIAHRQTVETWTDNKDGKQVLLVVEDNADIRNFIRQILESDYHIVEAENGQEGVARANERIPDLIISDIMMPKMDGYELCKAVKSGEKTSHIPVILLTAKASNDSVVEGFETGADYFVTKPFHPRLLTLRVQNALKTRNEIRQGVSNKKKLDIEPTNVKMASKDEAFIRKAVSIIEKNMSNSQFYVDDLGAELGLSRMQLYRKLKALIGQSANEFMRSIRLKRAAQLIRQNQLTISEITYEVGFNDLQYFRESFKKQFGVNPSDYASDAVEEMEEVKN